MTDSTPSVMPHDPTSSAAGPEAMEGIAERFLASGQSILVLAETDDGSARALLDRMPAELHIDGRLDCAPASKAHAGEVVDHLGVDDLDGGVIVLEDAQWADPSSLGHLQRLIRESTAGYLLLVAHRPLSEVDGWWLDRLASSAGRHAEVVFVKAESEDGQLSTSDLDSHALDLVIAADLITTPVSVDLASRFLDIDADDVLALGEDLTRRGLLAETRGGYVSSPSATPIHAGDARTGHVADRLAAALEATDGEPALIGALRLAAGQPAAAYPLLAAGAAAAAERNASGEAFHLAEAAIEAADQGSLSDDASIGELHLICGRFLRTAGRTDASQSHLDRAASLLTGTDRLDALRLGASNANDAQRPQEAERIVAMAELEAIRLGESSELGALLTYRARTLNRIGFPQESDAALAKGEQLLLGGATAAQRLHAGLNRAGIHFDRGEAAKAEVEFSRLLDLAEPVEGEATLADTDAWRARALFLSGRPDEAIEAVELVMTMATKADVEAPLLLAQLALAEGGLAYGRYDDALIAADRALDLIERTLPDWENMVRAYRAEALLRVGRGVDAKKEAARSMELSPHGPNGWRWRVKARAILLEAEEKWDEGAAEDLADVMLQSRFYGWAAELLCAIAERGKKREAAAESMAIATSVGLPMLAARAAHAGKLWDDPAATPTILAIHTIRTRIPADWRERWEALPQVAEALRQPTPADDIEMETATAAMDEALRRAGLSEGEMVLSPAQRRSRGLARTARRRRPLQLVAAAVGVIALAGATAYGVSQLSTPEVIAAPTTIPQVVSTQPLALEETEIATPEDVDFFFGTAEHRGGYARTGVVDSSGLREVSGYYWKVPTGGAIEAPPVAFGNSLYVGTTEGTFYVLDQTTGRPAWTLSPEGRISAAPVIGRVDLPENQSPMMVVVVDDEGVVRGQNAADGSGGWSTQLGSRIRSSPVLVDGVAVVATTGGMLHGLDLGSGEQLWQFPAEGDPLGAVSADMAYADGLLYVGTQDGIMHVIDFGAGSPTEVCRFDALESIVTNPIVIDDIVYVPTAGQSIWALPAGECDGTVRDRLPFYVTETPVEVPPAIVGDIMYLPDGRFLYARNLVPGGDDHWEPGKVSSASPISAPPVVAGDTVYFASEDGIVHAVDADSGDLLWQWQTGLHVRAAPAVVDGVVFVVSGDGFIYALGG